MDILYEMLNESRFKFNETVNSNEVITIFVNMLRYKKFETRYWYLPCSDILEIQYGWLVTIYTQTN